MRVQPTEGGRWSRLPAYAVWGLILVGLLLAPLVSPQFWIVVGVVAIYQAYQSVAWNIVAGYAGQLSIANAVFVAIGGYTSVLLYIRADVSPWLGMWVGAAVSALMGAFIGWLFFRVRATGMAFALGTFAVSQVALWFIIGNEALNRRDGFIIPQTLEIADFQFDDRVWYYYVGLAMLAALVVSVALLRNSRLGYYFLAIREDQDAAEALGVNLVGYKTMALTISAVASSLGGSFLAQFLLYAAPELFLSPRALLVPIVAGMLGGLGTITGPAAGALLIIPFGEFLRSEFGSSLPGIDLVVYGIVLVLVMRFMPRGVVGSIRWRRLQRS